jgi:hypothetical protein
MQNESILVMNDIEKEIAEGLIRKINDGNIPAKGQVTGINMGYECFFDKQEKIIHGFVSGCPYRLRYRDSNRVFFSAWHCKDVCAVFYDMVALIHSLSYADLRISELFRPFDVDLNTERYVFFSTDTAVSFAPIADRICGMPFKMLHGSQYVFSVFDDSDDCKYSELIQRYKAEGYSKVQILQIWIRGEVLCYALVDGAILRPERQRTLTAKEEADLARKMQKELNDKFRRIDLAPILV